MNQSGKGNLLSKNGKFLQTSKRYLRHLFLHNGGFKILALLISIVLWAGLISQDETLTRDKTFYDVSVNVTGTDTMKRNGFIIVSDLTDLLGDAFRLVGVKQYDVLITHALCFQKIN